MTTFVVLMVIFGLLMVGWAWEKENEYIFEIPEITTDAKELIPAGDALLGSGFFTLTANGFAYDFCKSLICKGQVFHATAVKIPPNTKVYSFSTKFTFSMEKSSTKGITGDGFVFFLGKYPRFKEGDGNGHFGLFLNDSTSMPTKDEQNSFFGIEFDTLMNVDLHDKDDNHLGVNINSAVSVQVVSANVVDVVLNDGKQIMCWIDWNKDGNYRVEARISYAMGSALKPIDSLFNYTYDLDYTGWDEFWTGFSSSSSLGFEQRHLIHNWYFKAHFEPLTSALGPQVAPIVTRTSWARLVGSIVGATAIVVVSWCFMVKYTKFGKQQHVRCMKLLLPKFQEIKAKLFKKKEGGDEDDDEKSISVATANVDSNHSEDQEDDEDEEVGEEGEDDKHNNAKSLPSLLLSTSPPPPRGRVLPPPPQSKMGHPHPTPSKPMHSSPPPLKLMQLSPPRPK